MNQAGRKVRLMTYEVDLRAQAELGKVPFSTTERKVMTKSIKRVAVVAALALGLGGLTSVAANAGQGIAGGAVSLASASSSATVGVETTVTATLTGYCLGVSGAGGDSQNNRGAFAIYVDTVPANGTGTITGLALTKSTVTGNATDNQDNAAAIAYDCTAAGFFTGTATAKVTLPSAGTYTFKIAGVYQVGGSATWSVTAAPKGAITAASSTISATTITGSKTNGVSAGSVNVAANNAAGNADAAALSASVSGPGLVSWTGAFGAAGRAVAQAANNAGTLTFYGDGTAGVGTVSIYSGSTLLGTVTATFYGTAAKLIVTPSVAALSDLAGATTFATVSAVDANGVAVPIAAADGTPSTTNGVFADVAGATAGTVALTLDPAATVYGSKTTTWTHGATGLTVDASVMVSSATAATLTVATPNSTLVPGAKYTITVTEKDANGYVVPDGTRYLAISTSRASSVAVPTFATFANGVASVDLYAPVTPGDFTVTVADNTALTGGNALPLIAAASASTTVLNTQTVSLGNQSQDAIDAANEATDAANAATDAANAAAEAADAATAAAQDAQAAVAALAAQVADLIAGLKAQITALTNLVIKIQKKVKA